MTLRVNIIYEDGRLGNQLFQYYGLLHYFPCQTKIFFGFDSLSSLLSHSDVFLLTRKTLKHLHLDYRFLATALKLCVKLRLFTRITEVNCDSEHHLKMHFGIFWFIRVIENSYFQHNSLFNCLPTTLAIPNQLITVAKKWLFENTPQLLQTATPVFIHVRRGDYLTWPSASFPAALDSAWYLKQIEKISLHITTPLFVVVGDDHGYNKSLFSVIPNAIVSDNNAVIDLALMSLCSSGILSSSSFAWWGAFCSRNNHTHNKLYIAPDYWNGHSLKSWEPPHFQTPWLTYL